MSYLDVPRFHFSGGFFADPSTSNNFPAAHNNTAPIPGPPRNWDVNGRHFFQLKSCTVKSAVDASGTSVTASAKDSLVGSTVASTDVPSGRLVDLDPDHQTGSQIWGLEITVTDAGEGFTAVMDVASLRELWAARAPGGFAAGFGGTYQSVLTGIKWMPVTAPMHSPVLNALRTSGATRFSIRMVTWAYNAAPGSTGFNEGKLVGTIGPAAAGEPVHFNPDRRLVHAGGGPGFAVAPMNPAAFNTAPFKVDAARKRLVIDFGNCLPEDATGARRSIGALRAEMVNTGGPATVLGTGAIPNATASYLVNAGIEEIPLSATEAANLATRSLRVKAGSNLVLAERTAGVSADVSETVVRLNPTETKDVELVVTQLGRPMKNAQVHVGRSLAPGRPAGLTAVSVKTGAPAFGTTLTLPALVTTDANGRLTLRIVASDPGHPRPDIDGQVSFLGVFVGASPTAANQHAEIAVRVYDKHAAPAGPVFADVEPILTQYFRLYPSMRQPTAARPFGFVDLNDLSQVQPVAPVLAAALRRPETAANYMPVTRDLSRDKKALLLKWLDAGAPA